MTDLRPITDAEAHPWPRTCRVCGLSINAASCFAHQAGHIAMALRETGQDARAATHAMNALGDAIVRAKRLLDEAALTETP